MLRYVASSTLPKLCADAEWSTVYEKTGTTIQTRRGPALQIKKSIAIVDKPIATTQLNICKELSTHPSRPEFPLFPLNHLSARSLI